MREIILDDAFKLARIIKNANVRDEIVKLFQKIEDAKDEDRESLQKRIGMEFVAFFIESCGDDNVKKSFYDLIAGIAEMKAEEVANLKPKDAISLFKQIAKENDLKDFLSSAVDLIS